MSWKRRHKGRLVDNLPNEQWKEMEEFETQFNTTEISNHGRVKRVNKNELFHRKIVKKKNL